MTTATLLITGQDCVYQVWSFLGRHTCASLVAGLRFVTPERCAAHFFFAIALIRLFLAFEQPVDGDGDPTLRLRSPE